MRQGDRRGADLDQGPPAAGVLRRDPGPAADRRGADLDQGPPAAGVLRRDPGPAVDRRGADLDQGPPAAGVLRRDTGPAADRRGAELDLVDYTYDGAVVDGGTRLVGGLGQLTDGDQARHIQF